MNSEYMIDIQYKRKTFDQYARAMTIDVMIIVGAYLMCSTAISLKISSWDNI